MSSMIDHGNGPLTGYPVAVVGWRLRTSLVTGGLPVRFPELTVTTEVPLSKAPNPQLLPGRLG